MAIVRATVSLTQPTTTHVLPRHHRTAGATAELWCTFCRQLKVCCHPPPRARPRCSLAVANPWERRSRSLILHLNSDPMSKLALTFHRSPRLFFASRIHQAARRLRRLSTHALCVLFLTSRTGFAGHNVLLPPTVMPFVRALACVRTPHPPSLDPLPHRTTLPSRRSHRATAVISRTVCSQHSVLKRESHPALVRAVRVDAGWATSVAMVCFGVHC